MEEEDENDHFFDQLATGHDFDLIKEMLSTDEFISFPINYKLFKNLLREEGIPSNSLRRLWWPVYFYLIPDKELESYPDISRNAFKKYRWATYKPEEENIPIDLSWGEDHYENITFCVMKLIVQHFDIQDPGLLHPLVQQISKVLTNKAICYTVITEIIERPSRYLTATPFSHRCKLHAFRELAKRCMIHTHHILEKIGALEEQYLNLIFVDMFTTILPNDFVNSILDIYLYDGVKVLYRYGLALFKLHKRRIKSLEFKTGEDFWTEIKRYQKEPELFDFAKFHNFAFDREQNVLKTKIVPPRATIHEYELSAQSVYSIEQLTAPLNLPYELSLSSIEDVRTLLHNKSRILDLFMARRLHSYLPQTMRIEGFQLCFATYLHGWNLNTLYSLVEGRYPCLIIIKSVENEAVIGAYITTNISPPSSNIKGDGGCFIFRLDGPTGSCHRWALLNHQQPAIVTIQPPPTPSSLISSTSSNVPSPLSPNQPITHFSPNTITSYNNSNNNNNNNNNNHNDNNENNYKSDLSAIPENTIEAPISLPEIILPPSSHLSLQHQHNNNNNNNNNISSNNNTNSNSNSQINNSNNNNNINININSNGPFPVISKSKSLQLIEPNIHLGSATFHQFINCTVDYMAIGGSHRHGTNAIRITSDLMLCSCGHSDTYNNKCLTPDEPVDPWYISDIEVYCGQHIKKK